MVIWSLLVAIRDTVSLATYKMLLKNVRHRLDEPSRARVFQMPPTRRQFRLHCDSAVREAFTLSKQHYGLPCLTDELHTKGYHVNVKTVTASICHQKLWAKDSQKFS